MSQGEEGVIHRLAVEDEIAIRGREVDAGHTEGSLERVRPWHGRASGGRARQNGKGVSRGTPAEVDGLSNGGAGQKGRLECLDIISLLRRPLIFLPNVSAQERSIGEKFLLHCELGHLWTGLSPRAAWN